MRGPRCLTAAQLAARSGVDLELAWKLRRAMGLPDVPDTDVAFYDGDLEALRRADALLRDDRLDVNEVLYLTRTLGLAAARMADAIVGFWLERRPGRGPDPANGEVLDIGPLADAERVEDVEQVVLYLFRRHLIDAVSRRLAGSDGTIGAGVTAVGFADLVGFTSLSEQLNDWETAALVERFEETATDQIVGGGGRVVKMIGDEVMFSANPVDVGEIALSLAESFASPDIPSVHVGVASGHVVAQSGDLYGPAVNLAARATMAARPGSVLVSDSVAASLRGDGRYQLLPTPPRRLKGIGEVPLWLLRRANLRPGSATSTGAA